MKGTTLATTILFTQLDDIQDINVIQLYARQMHARFNKGEEMEPWDVISKIQTKILTDHKYWEKEEIVEAKPNSSFLANAPLKHTQSDNRRQPSNQRKQYLSYKPRWLQNHEPPKNVQGATLLPSGDYMINREGIDFFYCEKCSVGPHIGLWNRTHTTSQHRDSVAPHRNRNSSHNPSSRAGRGNGPSDTSRFDRPSQ